MFNANQSLNIFYQFKTSYKRFQTCYQQKKNNMKQNLEGCDQKFFNPALGRYSNNEKEIKKLVLNQSEMASVCEQEKPFFDNYTAEQKQVGRLGS